MYEKKKKIPTNTKHQPKQTNIVRSIYFFLLPSNVQSAVVDYTLAVLPSFIFFTTFSVALSVWATIAMVDTVAKRNKVLPLVFRTVIVINLVLYLTFIACVIAYDVSASAPTSITQCGKTIVSVQKQSEQQHSVSIAYASILFIISFGASIAFFFFGYRVATQLKASGTKTRFFKNSAILSLAFVLHAIFILVLILLPTPNIWFSFFGLLITEIIPGVGFVFVAYTTFQTSSRSRSGSTNKKSHLTYSTEMKGKTSNSNSTKSNTMSQTASLENVRTKMSDDRNDSNEEKSAVVAAVVEETVKIRENLKRSIEKKEKKEKEGIEERAPKITEEGKNENENENEKEESENEEESNHVQVSEEN